MIETIWGATSKPVASKQLAETLEKVKGLDGTLYIGYPVIGTPEGAYPFDALLLSPSKGLITFHIVEGKVLDDYVSVLDENYNRLQAKLLNYSALTKKRKLGVLISTLAFAPAVNVDAQMVDEDHPLVGIDSLPAALEEIEWESPELYATLASTVQAVSTIRRGRKRREVKKADSRGARLKGVEDSIANLDSHQSAAVIETVDGVQRIRGLAGSGKTIVLALKVAYLHAQHPDWKIAVTFNTRSLKGQFERFINTFVAEQTNEEPDWDRIEIINAWGAPGDRQRDGIYHKFCVLNGLNYLDFKSAENEFGSKKSFEGACEKALTEAKNPKQIFDAILVDEAQDFSPSFLRLCYSFLKPPKRLVYAYDELQSLTSNSLPSPEDIFGKKSSGDPVVTFSTPAPGVPRQDIILQKCYRNSRPLLATAHALGFGIYREPQGLIQMFEQKELWQEVGYRVHGGSLDDGKFVSLERTEDTSPKFLEIHSDIEDLIQFKTFESEEDQTNWLVQEIQKNVTEDELNAEDIIVINPEPLKTRSAVGKARSILLKSGINSSIAGVTNSTDIFFESDAVTFTGVFRAKGNEGAMVYVINAQDCYSTFLPSELGTARNRLFTAITRSKAWVRVIGVGPNMKKLQDEFSRVKEHEFRLEFKYPDEEQRNKLQIINRDMTAVERRRLQQKLGEGASFIEALESGEIEFEDLSPELIDRLNKVLKGR
ncbi:DEAD/DEAH box helicase [Xanthomonas cucurbitae]|uniref:DNA 3'-5' helicase II n=1 Tax=Xanthomonas cucurbitae TaxID=56453 RepID=A0ABY7YDP0_9XANT|nr:ATP-binding domain-containing protein [Xanthomonas cucurbitae]WDM68105.1 ATP-binding domain-containing protein [Xanthomonas cucurbitae]WDM71978.1 ATP-binding domain-containing protein [Xanthomonas cucurbitae]